MDSREINKAIKDALEYHHNGEFKKADLIYLEVLSNNPENFEANHLHGCILSKNKKYDDALIYFKKAHKIDSENYELNNNIGLTYKNIKNYDNAEKSFLRAIEINPNKYQALYNCGILYYQNNRLLESLDYLKKTSNCDTHPKEIHKLLGEVYQALFRDYKEFNYLKKSEENFKTHLDKFPNDTKARSVLGLLSLWKGDIISAVEVFKETHKFEYDNSYQLNKNIEKYLSKKSSIENMIKHEFEQLTYIDNDTDEIRNSKFSKTYYNQLSYFFSKVQNDTLNVQEVSDDFKKKLLKPLYNKPPRITSDNILNMKNDIKALESQYLNSKPEIVVIDNFLTQESLLEFQKFCRNANIFKYPYEYGYVATFLSKGLSNKFFLELTEEMRGAYKKIFRDYRLTQSWIFKYDNNKFGTNLHSDQASVNVNYWLTPDTENLSKNRGGLIIWDMYPPVDWNFDDYNNSSSTDKIDKLLKDSGAKKNIIPYKENRCVIFNSKLFHKTDEYNFKNGYKSRRLNITMLFD